MKKSRYTVGVDIGGTKIACALVQVMDTKQSENYLQRPPVQYEDVFRIVDQERIATERHLGYKQIIAKIARLINSVCRNQCVEISSLLGIGIGVPGAVDRDMIMINGNTLALVGKNIAVDLQSELGFAGRYVCENDANCFAYAEAMGSIGVSFYHQHGVPISEQIAVGLILGTGCGGGFFCRGQIFRGKDSSALEIGHRIFQKDGMMCYCGRRGCTEQYLSGTALEADFNRRLYSQITSRPNAAEIFILAQKNDPVAVAAINQYRQHLAHLITDICNVFDPHYIVLGGGISQQESIYRGLQADMERELFVQKNPPQVKQNELGDSSGVFGAALLPLFFE